MLGKNRDSNAGDKPGFVKRLRARLNRGDSWLSYDLANLAPGGTIDQEVLDDLEAELVMADVGVDTTSRIIAELQKSLARKELKDIAALRVGVNGAGKTTTIGKLTKRLQDQGHSVMLAAGDTFRAAAVEQLQVWGQRNNVAVISQQAGADPAAVIFDA